ncbi:hypothetical protein GCM10023208_25290 [Erythrobacter westpacificensis]|uniref:Uncharacterized protein n=1 Tax=Erythrobacter westpacificensis TaxID=1055231 RepID=A0ABP9KKQ7_9SPHN
MGRNLDWSKPRRVYFAWYERRDAFEDRPCEQRPKQRKGKRKKRAKGKKFVPAKPLIRWVNKEPQIISRPSDPRPDDDLPPW